MCHLAPTCSLAHRVRRRYMSRGLLSGWLGRGRGPGMWGTLQNDPHCNLNMDGQGNSAPLQGCPSATKDVAVETPMKHYIVSFALPGPSPSKIQMDKPRKELMKGLWLIYLPSETVKSMYLGFL